MGAVAQARGEFSTWEWPRLQSAGGVVFDYQTSRVVTHCRGKLVARPRLRRETYPSACVRAKMFESSACFSRFAILPGARGDAAAVCDLSSF